MASLSFESKIQQLIKKWKEKMANINFVSTHQVRKTISTIPIHLFN